MMETFAKRMKWCVSRAMLLTAVLCCFACESIFDDEGDCDRHYFVRFVYDMNMLRADAFAAQVGSVDLYVFDAESGAYITHFTDEGEALASGDYRMSLNLAPGKYDLVAWCGLTDNGGDFTVAQSAAQREDLICTMARSRDEKATFSDRNLHALFHGALSVELPDKEGEHVTTIRLTKNTNTVNLSLHHAAGPIDPTLFEVTMTDGNGLMAHDNGLLADEPIEYRPWSMRSGTLSMQGETATYGVDGEDGKEAGFLIAELSTARLMADHDSRISIVDKENGKTVFSIPIVQWALMLRSANHANMGEQEYLDREDKYNLMVFLADDNKDGWMAMSIYINGWHIVNQEEEL